MPKQQQLQFCMKDDEILMLARAVCVIEDYYTGKKGSWSPMDVEWAKDATDHQIYIVQARPETVNVFKEISQLHYYELKKTNPHVVATGQSIGQEIVSGTARIIKSVKEIDKVNPGDIIITAMTDPDWVPALKKAAGIVTQMGGRTCHAAIVSRELRIPAIVGVLNIFDVVHDGMAITLDCSQGKTGYVYQGALEFSKKTISLHDIPKAPIDIMINCADPDRVFTHSFLPVDGVGLARIEFIINTTIKIHPLAILYPDVISAKERAHIKKISEAYQDPGQFYIHSLAQGIGTIAAAFYPKPVIVRFSDFKTNEYRNLIGGTYFEPHEENPMLGFRGAVRYYHDKYKEAFALECQALKMAREQMGLLNIKVMVPFVRTIDEGKKVIHEIASHGLKKDNLEIIMMCEIPSNVMLIDEFLADFDGISIGSNDLTQLTLGVDRDSGLLNGLFDERDPALKKMFALAIAGAQKARKYSGICGQAPSDYPELADYLIEQGIQSISLNPDTVISFLMRYKK